jgi:NAD-dependent deacetylase
LPCRPGGGVWHIFPKWYKLLWIGSQWEVKKLKPGIAALFDRISAARYCAALTGAGISTLSGIPDFRGKGGFYAALADSAPGAGDPEQIFGLACFERDPSVFYRAAGALVYGVDEKEPSVVHRTLAELESRGFLRAVITQNIDMLHQRAGSRRVIELHGSPRTHYCLRCAAVRLGFAEAAALVKAGALPRCPRCGRVLKPAITFFGESLPLEARRDAEGEAQKADLLLVLGTSLRVFPAADLPRTVLRRGGSLVIVNDMPTPLDDRAEMRFGDLGAAFEGLGELLR